MTESQFGGGGEPTVEKVGHVDEDVETEGETPEEAAVVVNAAVEPPGDSEDPSESSEERTDARGRKLHPWETQPKPLPESLPES